MDSPQFARRENPNAMTNKPMRKNKILVHQVTAGTKSNIAPIAEMTNPSTSPFFISYIY
jgi:hypothetical protein